VGGSGDGETSESIGDTLKAHRRCQHSRFGVGEDGDGKRHERRARGTGPTVGEQEPGGGGKPKRGATDGKAKHQPDGTHRSTEQGLEVEAHAGGSRLAGERAGDNDTGARPDDESGTAVGREKPLNGGTLDVAAGCNRPAKPKVAETVERLRKPEDGT
jgi:hypothetical protein